jgi:hypothetical protein
LRNQILQLAAFAGNIFADGVGQNAGHVEGGTERYVSEVHGPLMREALGRMRHNSNKTPSMSSPTPGGCFYVKKVSEEDLREEYEVLTERWEG